MVLPTAGRPSHGGKTRGVARPSLPGMGLFSRAGAGGTGLGHSGMRRHRKLMKDTIVGITQGDIRRLARRGGVKRISATIYHEIRHALKSRVQSVLKDVCLFLDHGKRKTVTATDIIFALKRASYQRGESLYGFDKATHAERKKRR